MLEDLTKLLESKQFIIEKTFRSRLPHEGALFWEDAHDHPGDLIGVIAQKK